MSAPKPLPHHIAIVMDGNGRWAERQGKPRAHGHQAGSDALKRTVEAVGKQGISTLTVYAFSSENWHRPSVEVKHLLELFLTALNKDVAELDENNVSLRFIGHRAAFNAAIRDGMRRAEAKTRQNTGLVLNVAVNYGGHAEITEAMRQLGKEITQGVLRPEQITEALIEDKLYTQGLAAPDLLIRTGGEKRLSNFLLWQMAYTELHFTDVLWPDFNAEHLAVALDDFAQRQRRFGSLPKVENA
jgi:undecaprenyl diphosphate synthase